MSDLAHQRVRAVPVIAVLALALALVLAGAVLAPPAPAGGPGVWTDISGPVGGLLVMPRVARDANGVLHVVWITEENGQELIHRSVAADGTPGAQQTLAQDWSGLGNPAIVYDASSSAPLKVFAGGMRSTAPDDLHDGLSWWTSSDGVTWTLQPGVVSGPGGIAYSSDVAAVATPSGVFQTWFGTAGVFSHRGLENGGDHDVNDVGNYGYWSGYGYDPIADKLWLGAAYNATDKEGLWVREIDKATGAGAGASFLLPQSATDYEGSVDMSLEEIPLPITGLVGQPGVIVAYPNNYPSANQVRVWRIAGGATTTALLATGPGSKDVVAVAATPDGRAWVAWKDSSGTTPRIFARRSNVGATAWGAAASIAAPPGTESLWQLAASAQADGRLDVLAQASKSNDDRIYHTQLYAALDVTVAPKTAKAKKAFTATVTVRDAGSLVAGAAVSAAGKSAVTDGNGVAKLQLKAAKAGKLTVTVTRAGYQTATAVVTVRR